MGDCITLGALVKLSKRQEKLLGIILKPAFKDFKMDRESFLENISEIWIRKRADVNRNHELIIEFMDGRRLNITFMQDLTIDLQFIDFDERGWPRYGFTNNWLEQETGYNNISFQTLTPFKKLFNRIAKDKDMVDMGNSRWHEYYLR